MISLIIGCMLIGITLLYFFKIDKLSNYIILSLPVGIVVNSIIFVILSTLNIYYNKYIFYFIVVLSFLFLIYRILKTKFKVKIDLKNYSLIYIIMAIYLLFRLITLANTSYFEFFHFDEFSAYARYSSITYISKDAFVLGKNFYPVMNFIGIMSFNINNGIDLQLLRTITPVFYILITLFIYNILIENKVNKYITTLIVLLFMFSSSENLMLSKAFYTNVIFSFYVISGVYLSLKSINDKSNNSLLLISELLMVGATFTRIEGIYVCISLNRYIFITHFIINRKRSKKALIILFIPIALWFGMRVDKNYMVSRTTYNPDKKIDVVVLDKKVKNESIMDKLDAKFADNNVSLYFKNLYAQTLDDDYYNFNYCAYIITLLSIPLAIIFLILNKENRKKYKIQILGIFYIELVYLAIVIYTQIFLFKPDEFILAASFSRYTLAFIPLNFIIFGICLFNNTSFEIGNNKEEHIKLNIKEPKVLIIIPAYNEEKNILNTYNEIITYNKKHKTNYDVIVINDGSLDDTEKVCIENNIPYISLTCNLGIGGAVQTGYKYADENDYDIAVQYDGDGQHDVNYIKNIITPIINGEADAVIGSRFIEKNKDNFNSTFFRRMGISLISFTIKICSKKKIYDTTSGFRAVNRNIIKEWTMDYPYEYPEPITDFTLAKDGYIIKEIPVMMRERKEGKSSIHTWKNAYYMINVILTILAINKGRNE